MSKRNCIARAFLALGMVLAASAAQAAGYPDKPVTLVVPYPPGGATDVIARLIAEKLPAAWGQQVIVNNRPGAGTTVAAEAVARSPGDGYTLYMTTAAHTISASLYKKLNYDPLKDFAPLTLTSTIPLVLVTAPSLPVNSLAELIAYAKASPQGLSMASTGNGTPQHLTGELFKAKAGLKLVHVPYRGDAPMLTDLIGGQVQMAFVTLSAALPHIQSGKLKAIALAHPRRVEAIGQVPTMAEAGLTGFKAVSWNGIVAPAGTPDAVVARLNQALGGALASPAVKQRLMEEGAQASGLSTAEFGAFIQAEIAAWAKAVKDSGATAN